MFCNQFSPDSNIPLELMMICIVKWRRGLTFTFCLLLSDYRTWLYLVLCDPRKQVSFLLLL